MAKATANKSNTVENKVVEMQAPTNPPVSVIVPKEPELIVNVNPETQAVTISPPSVSHPTLGTGFTLDVEEFNFDKKRGRQGGSERMNKIVEKIQGIRDNPQYHGKQLKIQEFDKVQTAYTTITALRKKYPNLVKDMSLLSMKVKNAAGEETGSILGVKYGIPSA